MLIKLSAVIVVRMEALPNIINPQTSVAVVVICWSGDIVMYFAYRKVYKNNQLVFLEYVAVPEFLASEVRAAFRRTFE
jgi:hypothetical protein